MARRPLTAPQPIRIATRWVLAIGYATAGALHLVAPAPFVRVTPDWVLTPLMVVYATGVAELLGAAGLLQPWSLKIRKAAGVGLGLYALCVWPANFHHLALDMAHPQSGLGLGYHVPRLLAQPLIIWGALWAGEATEWPFARRTRR